MAITTLDGLVNALGNSAETLLINKASLANQAAGVFCSFWRATGTPGQGTQPSTATVCDNTTTGGLPFTNPPAGQVAYLARLFSVSNNTATDVQIYDRLLHRSNLSAASTAQQAVELDASVTDANMAVRRGAADYSDVLWWIELQADIGTTARNATVNYTRPAGGGDGTIVVPIGGASPLNRNGRMLRIDPGEPMMRINHVTIDTSTGAAGTVAVVATRLIASQSLGLANSGVVYDWAMTGLPRVSASACLFPVVICGTTSSGTLFGSLRIVSG
jgi:hypothetical protein